VGPTVYRPVTIRLLLGVVTMVAVSWVAALVIRGRLAEGLLFALWLVAGLAALGCLFWRPAVVVDDSAVELRNVVRDVRVPWARLEEVTTRFTLTLHADGRRHQSWAGVAPGRSTVAHRLPDHRWNPSGANPSTASRDVRADSGATAFLVEQGWRAWRERQGNVLGRGGEPGGRPDEVEVRWRLLLPGAAVGSALLALMLTPVLG
jgi:hypothetical protein